MTKEIKKNTDVEGIPARASLQRALGVIFFLGLLILILFFSGYRLSGLDAAKANFDVGKGAEPFGEVDMGWGKVYLLHTANELRTVGCYKTGILWRCPVSSWSYNNSVDAVQTVGWMSWINKGNEQITVMAVKTTDPRVAYIEAGEPSERIRKNISIVTPIIFNWSKAMLGYALNPVALASDGHILYEDRYPKNTSVFYVNGSSEDYRWYPVDSDR